MDHRRRLWLAAALAAALLLALYLVSRRPPGRPGPVVPAGVGVEFEQMTVRGRSPGGREWRLRARTMRISRDRITTTLIGIREATLGLPGRSEFVMSADLARLNTITGNLEVSGRVHLQGASDYEVRAQGLRWLALPQRAVLVGPVQVRLGKTSIQTAKAYYHAPRRVIECPGRVQVQGPDGDLAGQRLTADLDREEYVLEGAVTMRLSMAEAERTLGAGQPPAPLGGLAKLLGKGRR